MYCIFTTARQQLRTACCHYYKCKPVVVRVLSPSLLWPACGSGAPCFSEAPVLMLVPQLISLCIGTRFGSDSARYLTICQKKWLFQLARAGCDTGTAIAPHDEPRQRFPKLRPCWLQRERWLTPGVAACSAEKCHAAQLLAALLPLWFTWFVLQSHNL